MPCIENTKTIQHRDIDMHTRFQEIAARTWDLHPACTEQEFLEHFGREVVKDCAQVADNYTAMNIPGAMLGSLILKQFGVD